MRRAVAVALLGVLALAAWTRLGGLGRLSYWADELPHAIAAASINDGNGPELPSGRSYGRAAIHTRTVALAMRALGGGEGAARLPSAIAGIALVLLVFRAVRTRFGDASAIAASAIVALSAPMVAHSRSARFYMAFVVAYGIAAVLATETLRRPRWRTAAGAALAFAVALHLHVLALTMAVPLAVLALRLRRGWLVAAAAVAVVAVLAFVPEARTLVRRPLPGLRLDLGFRPGTALRPLGILSWWAWMFVLPAVLWLRRWTPDGHAAAVHAFGPSIAVALLYRSEGALDSRFLLHTMPFVAALAGAAIAGVRRVQPRAPRPVVLLAALLAAGSPAILAIPWEEHPGRVVAHPNWRAAAAGIEPDAALLTTSPLAAFVYEGRCGAWLRAPRSAAPYVAGGRDVYCGVPLVAGEAAIERSVADGRAVVVLADRFGWERTLTAGMRATVERLCRRERLPDETVRRYSCATHTRT